ncbi:hypothetical protein FHX52_0508 [Humibacillus xanthopallidus]|uniref:Uncharacterized protein n=1 Tax=Humibacillus xanthopallidus TaxID=412689 RepID=A0A543PTK8_9MICO|nr:hypothetical protein [Humibacillus xanthopallidus]TQN47412.1 hypothetical protein FHX52_0508 [Humibacillus xanthopallidus]
MARKGYTYAGDCGSTQLETDVGKYCSSLYEKQPALRIYSVGPTFSEYTTWLLLRQSSGTWRVTAAARITGMSPPPW